MGKILVQSEGSLVADEVIQPYEYASTTKPLETEITNDI